MLYKQIVMCQDMGVGRLESRTASAAEDGQGVAAEMWILPKGP